MLSVYIGVDALEALHELESLLQECPALAPRFVEVRVLFAFAFAFAAAGQRL